MCALYGFVNYGKILSQKELKKLVRRLSVASECRGRDASGVAYVRNGKVIIYKKPQPSCEVNFYFPPDITILTGHTRMATQGNARNNYNNHPFAGHTVNGDFALCHNGVLFNYDYVRNLEHLPHTKIKTDTYAAVQLLEKYGKANFENIGKMSELVNGSFVFTILTDEEKLYISYTSTEEIMQTVVKGTIFEKQQFEVISVSEGEMISIDKQGKIEKSRFAPIQEDYFGYYDMYGGYRDRYDYDSYLYDYCNMFGISEEELMLLYEMGYDDEEIELMMTDHDLLRKCLDEAKEMVGIYA